MTEFILELAALLIVLFCTIKPSGGSTLRSDRHGDAG